MPYPVDLGDGTIVHVDDYGNPMPVEPDAFASNPYLAGGPSAVTDFSGGADAISGLGAPPALNAPAPTQPSGPAPGTSSGEKVGGKVAISKSVDGIMDPDQLAASRAGFGKVGPAIAGINQRNDAEATQAGAGFVESANITAQAQVQATDAQAAQFDAKAAGDRELAALTDRHVMAQEQGRQVATARTAAKMQDFQTQLAKFTAMSVNPGELFGNMTGGERFGTLVSAFVTDFLGTKGIKTSAMDHFNRAVDRNIDAQVQNIKKHGEVTQQFKAMWEMSMQEGATEAEAIARIQALSYAGAQKAVEAEVGKYDSDIARAQGAAAIAQIQEQLQGKLLDINDKFYQRSQLEISRALDLEYKSQQISLQKRQLAISAAGVAESRRSNDLRAQGEARAARAGQAAKLNSRIIIDPNDPSKVIGAGRTDEQASKIREQLSAKAAVIAHMTEVREMLEDKSIYQGKGKGFVNSEAEHRAEAVYNTLLSNYAKMQSGATVTEGEIERLRTQMPFESWSTNPDILGTYSDNILRDVKATEQQIHAQVGHLTADEQSYIDSGDVALGSNYKFAAGENALAEVKAGENHGKPVLTTVDAATAAIDGPESHDFVDPQSHTDSGGVDPQYTKLLEDWKVAVGELPVGKVKSEYNQGGGEAVATVPKFAEGLKSLHDIAVDPDTSDADRQDALTSLSDIADSGNVRGAYGEGFQEQSALAQYYLQNAASSLGVDVGQHQPEETPGYGY